jgi:hypothetical protein
MAYGKTAQTLLSGKLAPIANSGSAVDSVHIRWIMEHVSHASRDPNPDPTGGCGTSPLVQIVSETVSRGISKQDTI